SCAPKRLAGLVSATRRSGRRMTGPRTVRGALKIMPSKMLVKGTKLDEWDHPVEWGKVREFARAVHDPLSQQEPPEPPITFPVALTAEFIERFIREILPLDRTRTVHGEQ